MPQKHTILIADDHPIFADGLRNALLNHPRFTVVATVANGAQVLQKAIDFKVAVVILDINMPGKTGLEVLRELKTLLPNVKVVLMTMYIPAEIDIDPATEPTDGYVLKNSGTEVLLEALEAAVSGRRYFDPAIYGKQLNHANDSFARQAKLSGREKEILKLILTGHTNQQIAGKLYLSELTIKTHRKNIMQKMDAHNLADLLQKAQS